MCSAGEDFRSSLNAGFSCVVDGVGMGDSNFGMTPQECGNEGGSWTPYDCQTANSYLELADDNAACALKEAWAPKCCGYQTCFDMCSTPESFQSSANAGFSCLVDGVGIGDSNFGMTQQECGTEGG